MDVPSAIAGKVEWRQPAADAGVLHFSGDWTLAHFALLEAQLAALRSRLPDRPDVDFTAVTHIDTAGAGLIAVALGPKNLRWLSEHDCDIPRELTALLDIVSDAVAEIYAQGLPRRRDLGLVDLLAHIGQAVVDLWHASLKLLGFVGMTLEAFARATVHPTRRRLTSVVYHMEQTGIDAVPIVLMLSFLLGAVLAFLGAAALQQFGVTVFTVDLVSYAFTRELSVVLTAILLAGRTASTFTAQIGSMKAGHELDALRTMGLDPVELLVVPRTLALVIVAPLLTFLSMLAGVLGGMLVCAFALDITPAMFISVFQRDIPLYYVWLGLAKAPLFGFAIAVIGCVEGFKVDGSASSLGERTTSGVVQSIFMVIVLDALAALFYLEMGW